MKTTAHTIYDNSVEQRVDQKHAPTKLQDWENEPTVMELKSELALAEPWNRELVTKVQKWRALREAQAPNADDNDKDSEPRSKVQPKLVRRQAEWRYPALTEPFLSTDDMYEVNPTGWEDDEAAKQNGIVINHQFRTKMNRVQFIDRLVRTCVDEGTAFVRPGWVRETKMVKKMVPSWAFVRANEMQAAQITQAAQLAQTNPQEFGMLPEDLKAAVEYSVENGVLAMAVANGEIEVEEEEVVKNQPTLDIMRCGNVYLDPNCEDDVSNANFVIYSFPTSKAKLKRDGRYKNLDQVKWSDNSPTIDTEYDTSRIESGMDFKDDLRKSVVAYEYWGFYDIHGTGELVPIVATWIGDTMIRMEENPFPDQSLPLVIIPYLPVLRSVTGEPDAEILEDNQALLGALMRGMVDLMGKSANSQTGVARGFLDTVNRRRFLKGLDYEFNPTSSPETAIYQHKFPEISMSAFNLMSLQNQEAEALTGVKAFSGGLSGEAYGEVAAGIKGMLDAAAKREMSILRRVADGMIQIGRKMIMMNQAFLSDEEIVRLVNKTAVRIRRDDLAGQFDLKVDISTAEVDAAKASDLAFMLQTMGNNMPMDMVKMLLAEIAKLKRMPLLAKMIMDYEPQPDPVQQKLQELEIAKLDAQIMEIRTEAALNEAKARKALSEADKADLEFLETESGVTHQRDLEHAQAQAQGNQATEITKALLTPRGEDNSGPSAQDIAGAIEYSAINRQLT